MARFVRSFDNLVVVFRGKLDINLSRAISNLGKVGGRLLFTSGWRKYAIKVFVDELKD